MTKVLLNILFVIKKPYLFYPNTKFMTLVFCKLSNDFRIGFFLFYQWQQNQTTFNMYAHARTWNKLK